MTRATGGQGVKSKDRMQSDKLNGAGRIAGLYYSLCKYINHNVYYTVLSREVFFKIKEEVYA